MNGAGARVLLVDDHALNADMLRRRLERRDFQVTVAVDGAEALAHALIDTPALVLMDLNLPVIDGWQALELLRRTPHLKTVPVIALTAHADEEDGQAMLAAGFDAVETKPIDLPRLLEVMMRHIREAQS